MTDSAESHASLNTEDQELLEKTKELENNGSSQWGYDEGRTPPSVAGRNTDFKFPIIANRRSTNGDTVNRFGKVLAHRGAK